MLNNWANGIDEILEIRTTNRTIRCNAKHRLLVRRATERLLLVGETVGRKVGGKKVRLVWQKQYAPAGELKPGDTLVTLERLPDNGRTFAPNGRQLTNGFMEFCGLLLGDGNITKQNGRPSHVSIARGEEERRTIFASVLAAGELTALGLSGTAFTKREG